MASEQLRSTINMLRKLEIFTGDLEADRAAMGGSGPDFPDHVPHEPITVAGRPAVWAKADGATDDAAILYLHGGGYVMGGIGTHGGFAARLSTDCGTRVLLLDYRLGPEHKHPAALDDAVAAWHWMIDDAGIDPSRTIIAGDSAGGGLTLATLVALRDRGAATPAAGVALSPWADLTLSGATYATLAEADPLVGESQLRTYAAAYADGPLDDPLLSPLFADLSDLPPVLVQVGGLEVLLDDSVRVAAAIEAAGGDVTLQKWDEAPHVFQLLGAPESDEAIAEIAAFVGRQIR